jgi:hypothetical protein
MKPSELPDPGVIQASTLCLLIGPESSGTRFFESVLSAHPLVLGTPDALEHGDVLDPVWQALESGNVRAAIEAFPPTSGKLCVATRRSMPHADVFGEPAVFMQFPSLWSLHTLSKHMNLDLTVFITSRSPVPNIASWAQSRLSVDGSFEKAKAQYQAAYRYLYNFIGRSGVTSYVLSLEALLLDQQHYAQSIFQLLGLPPHPVKLDLKQDVNRKHYGWYL